MNLPCHAGGHVKYPRLTFISFSILAIVWTLNNPNDFYSFFWSTSERRKSFFHRVIKKVERDLWDYLIQLCLTYLCKPWRSQVLVDSLHTWGDFFHNKNFSYVQSVYPSLQLVPITSFLFHVVLRIKGVCLLCSKSINTGT